MMDGWHYEYFTRVTHVQNGDPWPTKGSVLVSGQWGGENGNQKLITIEPHRGYGGQYARVDTADRGLTVWWIERVMTPDTPPRAAPALPLTEYEKLREVLGV